MMTTFIFATLLGDGGGFRSKLLKAMDTVVVTPQKQAFIDNCQNPLQQIQSVESSAGAVSKDTLRAYWDVQIKPDGLALNIAECAAIATEAGSDLQKQQQESVKSLYAFFLELHKVIDTHGQPSFFDPSYMQLFDPSIALVDTHQACNPELMFMVEETISKSWMMTGFSTIATTIEGKTPLSDFETTLKADKKKYYDIAQKKSDACIAKKLENEVPYAERAPAAVRKEWLSTVKAAFTQSTDIEIVKIVFTTPEFKRFEQTKAEFTHSGDLNVNHQDYDAMDVMVYARNGEYVDGFIVTLYKDRVQNTAYARFYGFDAYGNLKPAHRVLPKNVK